MIDKSTTEESPTSEVYEIKKIEKQMRSIFPVFVADVSNLSVKYQPTTSGLQAAVNFISEHDMLMFMKGFQLGCKE